MVLVKIAKSIVQKGGKMTQEKRSLVVVKVHNWVDLSELLRIHRGLVKNFYQKTGRVVKEQFSLKQLHLVSRI